MIPTRINQFVIYIRVSEKEEFCYLQNILSFDTSLLFIFSFFLLPHPKASSFPKHVRTFSLTTIVRSYPYLARTEIHTIKNTFFFSFFYNGSKDSKDLTATWKIRCQNDETRVSLKTKDIHLSEFVCLYNTQEDLVIQPCALH